MERIRKLALFAGIVAFLPHGAAAHERQSFRVGDKTYAVVIGFLNEPVFVGDKSGVDLRIRLAEPNGKAVEGLERSLKVEISAGGKKKVFDLAPAFRDPGAYRAHFFPTAATTYGFRVFGELNATPVDLTFACGDGVSEEDTSEVKMSDRVTRISRSGAFGCPAPKDSVAFP